MRDAGWLTNVIGNHFFQPNPLVFMSASCQSTWSYRQQEVQMAEISLSVY